LQVSSIANAPVLSSDPQAVDKPSSSRPSVALTTGDLMEFTRRTALAAGAAGGFVGAMLGLYAHDPEAR
jgi:hypothetical protein